MLKYCVLKTIFTTVMLTFLHNLYRGKVKEVSNGMYEVVVKGKTFEVMLGDLNSNPWCGCGVWMSKHMRNSVEIYLCACMVETCFILTLTFISQFADNYLEGRPLDFRWNILDVEKARFSSAVYLLSISSKWRNIDVQQICLFQYSKNVTALNKVMNLERLR